MPLEPSTSNLDNSVPSPYIAFHIPTNVYALGVNSKVDLTVIIPVYNGGDYLQLTLESVVNNMTGFLVECVVINDGSTDGSAKIIEAFSDRIRVVNQANSGESAAVNKGLELARGKYALVVSADDPILTAEIFDGVVNFFENNPDVMAW